MYPWAFNGEVFASHQILLVLFSAKCTFSVVFNAMAIISLLFNLTKSKNTLPNQFLLNSFHVTHIWLSNWHFPTNKIICSCFPIQIPNYSRERCIFHVNEPIRVLHWNYSELYDYTEDKPNSRGRDRYPPPPSCHTLVTGLVPLPHHLWNVLPRPGPPGVAAAAGRASRQYTWMFWNSECQLDQLN